MKYRAFISAVEHQNITKAAQALGYTQSGISQMLRTLEEEIGFPLLIRSKQGVHLTQDGARLVPLIRQILNMQDKLIQLAADIQGLTVGEVRIGSYSSISMFLPEVIRDFVTAYPDVKIYLHEGRYAEIVQWLREGMIDFFFGPNLRGEDVEFYPLKESQIVAVLPKNHPMAGMESVPIEAFEKENVITPYRGSHLDVMHTFETAGIRPNSVYQIRGDNALIAMVANGFGISLLPEPLLRGHESEVAIRPLQSPVSRTLGIVVPSLENTAPAVKKFISRMQRFFKEKSDIPV